MTALFVYGTLLEGEPNHVLLKTARRLGTARTRRGFRLHDLGAFPGMVASEDAEGVVGEVYDVDDKTLAALDRLEGVPHFYERVSVELDDARTVEGYTLPPRRVRGLPVIDSGDWRAFRRASRTSRRHAYGLA